MEEGMISSDFAALIDQAFSLPDRDYSQYAPLTLAWIGDCVYDLIVRSVLVAEADEQPQKLHRKATSQVNARRQAEMMRILEPELTNEEVSIYRRGRNSSPMHTAKNADRRDYLEATGFETLIGYLYLEKRYARILELVKKAQEG